MALVDELYVARKRLFESLGDQTKMYCKLMKQWFSMKIMKEEFDTEVRKAMTNEQTRLHNEFLLCLFNKCTFLTSETGRGRFNNKKGKTGKQKRIERGLSQPGEHESPPQPIQENAQRFCVEEYFLPDQSFIMGRLSLGAWELGMAGAEESAAECIVIAVQYFIKNILTAVLIQRSGYKVKNKKKFIHSIGAPVANPWLRPQLPHKRSPDERLQGGDLEDDFVFQPEPLLSVTEREQQEVYDLACSTRISTPRPKGPITAYDLLYALTVYKSTIPSHSVYAQNLERIISALDHPSRDDLEAAKFVKT